MERHWPALPLSVLWVPYPFGSLILLSWYMVISRNFCQASLLWKIQAISTGNIDVNTRILGTVKNNLFSWPHVGSGDSPLEAELLSLQESLNTCGGPAVGLFWASSIFQGRWRSVTTSSRPVGLKCHFIVLSIFKNAVMLWPASSASVFLAGSKVLRSFVSLT